MRVDWLQLRNLAGGIGPLVQKMVVKPFDQMKLERKVKKDGQKQVLKCFAVNASQVMVQEEECLQEYLFLAVKMTYLETETESLQRKVERQRKQEQSMVQQKMSPQAQS